MDYMSIVFLSRVAVNIVACIMAAVFYFALLTPKVKLKRWVVFALTAAMTIFATYLCLLLYNHFALKLVISVVLETAVLYFLYQEKLLKTGIIAVFRMTILMLSECAASIVSTFLFGISLLELGQDVELTNQMMPVYMLCYSLFFGIPAVVAFRKSKETGNAMLLRFLFLPVSQAVMLACYQFAIYLAGRELTATDGILSIVMVVLFIATDVGFAVTINDLIRKQQLEEQQTYQRNHYQALMDQQQAIRTMRHDIANHLLTIENLVAEDPARAQAYAHELTGQFRSATAVDYCENEIADAVITAKAAEAKRSGIRFDVSAALSPQAGVADLDLMSLLSNLLDNALEEAKQCEAGFVELSIRELPGNLAIKVSNSLAHGTAPNVELTTKADKALHGQGVGILRSLAAAYGGEYLTNTQDGVFEATVMLVKQTKQ